MCNNLHESWPDAAYEAGHSVRHVSLRPCRIEGAWVLGATEQVLVETYPSKSYGLHCLKYCGDFTLWQGECAGRSPSSEATIYDLAVRCCSARRQVVDSIIEGPPPSA